MRITFILILIAICLQICFAQSEEGDELEEYVHPMDRFYASCTRSFCGSDEVCYNKFISKQECVKSYCYKRVNIPRGQHCNKNCGDKNQFGSILNCVDKSRRNK